MMRRRTGNRHTRRVLNDPDSAAHGFTLRRGRETVSRMH
jgi:hypothetical protein